MNDEWIPVIIESPYSGDVDKNLKYLNDCIRDCIARGETPYASHLMLTGALDDSEPEQRQQGIEAGFAWRRFAKKTVVYHDRGISRGMAAGIQNAVLLQDATNGAHYVVYRSISGGEDAP